MSAGVTGSVAAALARGRELLDRAPLEAQAQARAVLAAAPGNVPGRLLLGAALRRCGEFAAARDVLVPLAAEQPGAWGAHYEAGACLASLGQLAAATTTTERAVALNPGSTLALGLLASLRVESADYAAAAEIYGGLLARDPGQARTWLSYGHVLKTLGRQAEAVDAYRRSLALEPGLGEAYWSLANLKVVAFSAADLAAMEALLAGGDLGEDDQAHLCFALGKGLEDAGRYADAFAAYQEGNRLRRAQRPYDAAANRAFVRRSTELFTADFFAERAGAGTRAPDPIFVLGLPRSGSTLVEQILACHPQVEATFELPDLTAIAAEVAQGSKAAYPDGLAALPVAAFGALGAAYLARTQAYRKTARPRFVDKFPGNFMHVGLIQLILPRATIFDVRREAMAGCFSLYKQDFAQGQNYSYDLTALGRYQADYAALMAHFDGVLPGRVCRVSYEALVGDPEREVRRLLDHCGLAFEPACLRPHELARPVRTASSEQVRQPISSAGVEHWRHFEPWLGALKAALSESG